MAIIPKDFAEIWRRHLVWRRDGGSINDATGEHEMPFEDFLRQEIDKVYKANPVDWVRVFNGGQ